MRHEKKYGTKLKALFQFINTVEDLMCRKPRAGSGIFPWGISLLILPLAFSIPESPIRKLSVVIEH
jgi:hypothetical protein